LPRGLGRPQPVGLAARAHVDLVPRLVPDLGAAPSGRGEQLLALPGHVRVLRLDGDGQQRDVQPVRRAVAACDQPVQPPGVGRAVPHLGAG
jgi:hypothetical protein